MSRYRSLRQRWSIRGEASRTQLWPVPALGVVVAVVLGVGVPQVDQRVDGHLPAGATGYLFSGGPAAARTVLSVIAGSLVSVTSLTFSLTVVTLQLASSQYSPRILRTFTRDRLVHGTLAVLLATFTYAVTVLRTVRTARDHQVAFVPQIAVTVAYLLALASVLMLVVFLAHLAREIRIESMLRDVHAETRATMRRVLEEGGGDDGAGGGDDGAGGAAGVPPVPATGATPLCARSSGFLTSVDEQAVLSAAVDAGAVVSIDRVPGDSLIAGTPIATAWAVDGRSALPRETCGELERRVAGAIGIGFERTAAQDVAFGFRQLVDVASRALSPGINDPTTAVHALGHVAALLCDATRLDLGPRLLSDGAGRVRAVVQRPGLPALLERAVGQPARYGAAEPDVIARLLMLLREVAWSASRPEHRRAVTGQLERLRATMRRQDYDDAEGVRLNGLARAVQEALAGRWPPDAPG